MGEEPAADEAGKEAQGTADRPQPGRNVRLRVTGTEAQIKLCTYAQPHQ